MTLTVYQIQDQVAAAGKPVARCTIYAYFRLLKIKPDGAMQHPRRYPANTADKIIKHLGLDATPAPTVTAKSLLGRTARPGKVNGHGNGIVSMAALRRARLQSRRAAK